MLQTYIKVFIFAPLMLKTILSMETLTVKNDVRSITTRQILNNSGFVGVSCLKIKEDKFDQDLKRAISGNELINRLSIRIHKMFENGSTLSSGS